MTKQEANQLLEETFAKAFDKAFEENPEGAAKVIKNYNKLNITEYREFGKTTGNLRAVAMERLHTLPVVMAEQNGEVITMIVGSGFGDRNPTALEVVIQGSDVSVSAWAKEGLIPQKSAKKAVNAALKALGLL